MLFGESCCLLINTHQVLRFSMLYAEPSRIEILVPMGESILERGSNGGCTSSIEVRLFSLHERAFPLRPGGLLCEARLKEARLKEVRTE